MSLEYFKVSIPDSVESILNQVSFLEKEHSHYVWVNLWISDILTAKIVLSLKQFDLNIYPIALVDPEKKDSFNVNSKKEFICWDGHVMVNQGPKFYKS